MDSAQKLRKYVRMDFRKKLRKCSAGSPLREGISSLAEQSGAAWISRNR
jgi:hypothetical protein